MQVHDYISVYHYSLEITTVRALYATVIVIILCILKYSRSFLPELFACLRTVLGTSFEPQTYLSSGGTLGFREPHAYPLFVPEIYVNLDLRLLISESKRALELIQLTAFSRSVTMQSTT